jgi:hypothetical protein
MDTNKILLIVLGLIIFMVIMNHIVIITPTQSQVVPVPVPVPKKPIGGCAGTRYGCCPNGTTPKANFLGLNC